MLFPSSKEKKLKLKLNRKKYLVTLNKDKIIFNDFKVSAQCNRVNVTDGHTEYIQVNLKKKVSIEEIIKSWDNFESLPQKLKLPLAPLKPIHYNSDDAFPQPKHHRNIDKGMAVSVGRLREDTIFDYSFVCTVTQHCKRCCRRSNTLC